MILLLARQVFNSYSYETAATLQGHMGAVMSLSWSPDDTVLISAGAGGALYRWDAVRFERLREADHVDKAGSPPPCLCTQLSRICGCVMLSTS